MVDSETPPLLECPVCRSRCWAPSTSIRGASLCACRCCGLLGTESFVAGMRLCADQMYDVSAKDRLEYEKYYLPARLAFFRRLLPKLDGYRRGGRLLEIGSGYGQFLTIAAGHGWRAEGVELSSYASEFARGQGCNVHNMSFEEAELGIEAFDVVAMWDVIEHFDRPLQVIERCFGLLRPGGALVLRTPDARALGMAGGVLGWVYRQFVYPANTPEHVFHYTPDALQRILAAVGFAEIHVDATDEWGERVISGRNRFVRAARHAVMRYAFSEAWPYEFVLTAVKP